MKLIARNHYLCKCQLQNVGCKYDKYGEIIETHRLILFFNIFAMRLAPGLITMTFMNVNKK